MAIARAKCTCRTCGKTFEYTAQKHNRREADDFEAWAATHIIECDDCAQTRRNAERAEENEKSARIATENEYPALSGTDRQIPWAMTIRQKAIETLHTYCTDPKHEKDFPWLRHYDKLFTDFLLTRTSAAWWIENRSSCNNISALCHTMLETNGTEYRRICAEVEKIKKGQESFRTA